MTTIDTVDRNKKPSTKLLLLAQRFADTYMTSKEIAEQMIEQAKEEGIEKEQLREIVETALSRRNLSARQIRRILPPELKSLQMARKQNMQPKPVVNQWIVECDIKFIKKLKELIDAGHNKCIIVHDRRRVVDVKQSES